MGALVRLLNMMTTEKQNRDDSFLKEFSFLCDIPKCLNCQFQFPKVKGPSIYQHVIPNIRKSFQDQMNEKVDFFDCKQCQTPLQEELLRMKLPSVLVVRIEKNYPDDHFALPF